MPSSGFMIGQRVVYRDMSKDGRGIYDVICTVVAPPEGEGGRGYEVWINNPLKGYQHWVSSDNLKPLPGGQL